MQLSDKHPVSDTLTLVWLAVIFFVRFLFDGELQYIQAML